ncbi:MULTISPECIES: DUF4166 domain-containing protein [Arthrobacter]|uniref:DUF4166 domain-containing protein n=1 Tax=Arthrobacter oryzae TaxID=409290 RepID=A0A3N0C4Q5_9MICC|nr:MULTISPECIES: DUF4166 domain-containing protein [Arthrobacter]QYF89669.1 DUF4166 domain-containing protein [Arthrobacter sp. PAMC25284]RNL57070.1 DUF4166 domain-containing protein [Arthrobacter oryzae]
MYTPIYELALGRDFTRLQPELQEYFSLAPGSGHYGVGEGVFDVVGCRQPWLRPLLRPASGEQAFFPEYGEGIRFRIENHAHLDPFGRSSLTARREIYFPGTTRIFQDTTSVDGAGGSPGLLDYVGRYRRLVTDLNLSVTPDGRLRGVSEASRLLLGPLRIPLPDALDAKAYAEQWWDPEADGTGKHRIQVKVIQPQIGLVLVYAGHFDYRLEPYPGGTTAPGHLPLYAQPDRWERRT